MKKKGSRVLVKETRGSSWVTFLECISASGARLPCMMIFEGKNVLESWFPDGMKDELEGVGHRFDATENGWTSNPLALQWLLDTVSSYPGQHLATADIGF